VFPCCSVFTFVSHGRPPPTLYPFGRNSPPFHLIFPNNLSTSLPNVYLRASCLFPFGLKVLFPATSLFSGCSIFSSGLSCPLGPLNRFEACHCLALPRVVRTASGRPVDSISVEEALYFDLFVFLVVLAPDPILRWSSVRTLLAPLSVLCSFSVGLGRVMRRVQRTCSNSSPILP